MVVTEGLSANSIEWVVSMEAAKLSTRHRMVPYNKELFLSENVGCSTVEKPFSRGSEGCMTSVDCDSHGKLNAGEDTN